MTMLETLLEMGFTKLKAEKAVVACGENLDTAMEWLLAHQDDPALNDTCLPMEVDTNQAAHGELAGSDGSEAKTKDATDTPKDKNSKPDESVKEGSATQPTTDPSVEDATAKSLKCDECGKLFKSNDEVEFHAIKSGHSSFSESTEEKKPLTEEEKKQKLKDLEERLKLRRHEKSMEDRKEALEKEKKRIQTGKDVAEAKRKHDQMEMQKLANDKRREKLEDKMARQRVKEGIERDRLARKQLDLETAQTGAAKSATPNNAALGQSTLSTAPSTPSSTAATNIPKKDYSTTRLQIRLLSGAPLVQSFKASETLSAVRLYVNMNRTGGSSGPSFTLSTTFPRRIFTEEDMEKPLTVLDLVPSAVLVMAESKTASMPASSFELD